MRSKFIVNAAPKALCHVWRCFQRSSFDASKFRAPPPLMAAWPYQCMPRRELVEARQSPQFPPWVFHGELLQEQLQKNLKKNDEQLHKNLKENEQLQKNLQKSDELQQEQLQKKMKKNEQLHKNLKKNEVLHKNLKKSDEVVQEQLQKKIEKNLKKSVESVKITVKDVRRLVRLGRLEALKRRVDQIPCEIILYRDLLRVCMESVEQSSEEEAIAFVKLLDESGHILVSGPVVHLRPHKVVRALEMVMERSLSPEADRCSLELANLEDQKKEIDEEAERRAKIELWWGLGFFAVKTGLLMRWTFWELSWDVMEPVCFFLTSIYFMAGYAFFLRTSTAPTFEGVFKARFQARQRQIMKERNFDLKRFKQLNMISTPKFKSTAHFNQH